MSDSFFHSRRSVAAVLALVLPLALSGCSNFFGDTSVSVRQIGGASTVVPDAVPAGTDPEDNVVGTREHQRIVASYGGVYSNRKAEIMVARIAGKLLTAADQGNSSFTVTILDTPDVNAFALPGGYVYVTRGILALANDASELAAVMAHEIAHVTLRHARARSNRARTSQIVDKVITGVLGGNVSTDQTAARSRLSLAAFSQGQELAADKEGVMVAGQAGYDPHAAARFLAAMGRFAQLSSGQAESTDDFLSTHPSTPDRIQKAIEGARAFGAPGVGIRDRDAYLAAIDGLSFGDSPNQGAIVGRRFIHPVLKFTFAVPPAYSLQNSQTAVVAVAGDGEAVRFDSAKVPTRLALEDYLKSGWIAGLKPETVRRQDINGIIMVTGDAETSEWIFKVAVLRFEGEVYRFIFASHSENRAFEKAVDSVLKSFRRANNADIRRIQKSSIDLVTAKAGDTTRSLAKKMGPVSSANELFMVLNNLYDGDPIEPGRKYKIVRVD